MSRRKRTDGLAGKVEIMQGAMSGPPAPPDGVVIPDDVMPFWEIVTMAKAKRAWTKNDLVLAAEIARCMYRLEQVWVKLDADDVIPGDRDAAKEVTDLEKRADILAKRIRLLSVHLQIHTEATQGKARDQREQNKLHSEAVNFGQLDDDDLLASPMH